MAKSIVHYLGSQPMMKIIRGLMLSPVPRHIRDLAAQYELSPAGVSDIIRRLKSTGAIKEQRRGNRRCFSLNLSEAELGCLRGFFATYEAQFLEERAKLFSRTAPEKLRWMEEAFEFYRHAKSRDAKRDSRR